jgi:hypothetical protein
MSDPDPIACSLDAAELEARLEAASEAGRTALVSHRTTGRRHLLRFRGTPGTRARLEEIVAAERRCCPFLELELEQEGGELVLRIEAPPGAHDTAAGLAAAFTSGSGR